MNFELVFSKEAAAQLTALRSSPDLEKRCKAVEKALGLMETNLKHPSLQTHKMVDRAGPNGEPAFIAYAENRTPGAYRINWYYAAARSRTIVVASIIPHP